MSRTLVGLMLSAIGAAAVVGSGSLLLWAAMGMAPAPDSTASLASAGQAVAARTLTVSISDHSGAFRPQAAVVASGARVTFSNALRSRMVLQTAKDSPGRFTLRLPPGAHTSIRLDRPGLYHYYDALTARAGAMDAGNQVIRAVSGAAVPREGWIAVIPAAPATRRALIVPANQDLFSPKVVVTVVGGTVVVQNHDTDAHNFVVDPASPAGAAFTVDGTSSEPPAGWQRSLVLQRAGLYHVYCTLHTRVVGVKDGWHLVVPRSNASGYRSHNPMEAWIVVLPVTVG